MSEGITILSDPHRVVKLEAGGEIPFGPTLFSLNLNGAPHKLNKYLFLSNFILEESNTYLALVSYLKEKETYFTQLILLELTQMQYAIVDKYEGILRPKSLSGGILTFEKTEHGITTKLQVAISEVKNWQPLVADSGQLKIPPLAQLLSKYGYQLESNADDELRITVILGKKLLFSLFFTSIMGIVFLLFAINADPESSGPVHIVATIIGTILLTAVSLVMLNKWFFLLTINSSGVIKQSPVRHHYPAREIKGFNSKEETSYKYRSGAIDSYIFYIMLLVADGRREKLLHFSSRSKEEGLRDTNDLIKLLKDYFH